MRIEGEAFKLGPLNRGQLRKIAESQHAKKLEKEKKKKQAKEDKEARAGTNLLACMHAATEGAQLLLEHSGQAADYPDCEAFAKAAKVIKRHLIALLTLSGVKLTKKENNPELYALLTTQLSSNGSTVDSNKLKSFIKLFIK